MGFHASPARRGGRPGGSLFVQLLFNRVLFWLGVGRKSLSGSSLVWIVESLDCRSPLSSVEQQLRESVKRLFLEKVTVGEGGDSRVPSLLVLVGRGSCCSDPIIWG